MGNTYKNKNAQEILAERIAGLKAKEDENTSQNSQTLVDEDSIGKEKKDHPETDGNFEESDSTPKKGRKRQQQDFFVIDAFDASFKDDLASMEHPLFALKAGDTRIRTYEHNGNTVSITPSVVGAATIYDKDLWIYCISSLIAAKNKGDSISRTVRFTAYDYLVSTKKALGGNGYKRLRESLDRLAGTRIITNVATGGLVTRVNFGLIDRVQIVYADETDASSPMTEIEVTLPDWLYRSVESKQIKTISPYYFNIRKPLDRRIYELCAKHCGNQPKWSVSLEILHKKSGSTASLREFRRAVRKLVESNSLPDYKINFDAERDMVNIENRDGKKLLKTLTQ